MPPRTAFSGLAAFFQAQVFAAGFLGLAATPAVAETITGTARVIDGDSLRVDGHGIRLFGIDAPEYRQTCRTGWNNWACGTDAAAALRRLIDGQRLACLPRARDVYGRTVATCRVGERDVALEMLTQGLAVALAGATAEYLEARDRARTAQAGIWASQFDMPADYRAAHPRGETAQTNQPATTGSARPPSFSSSPAKAKSEPSPVWRSCAQARAAGAAPIHRGEPGYNPVLDGDGDGIACEPYRQRR